MNAVIESSLRGMRSMRETIALAALCLFIAAGSLAAVGWMVVRAAREGLFLGEVLTLDGLLMISVGLLVTAVFGFCFLWLANDAGLWKRLRRPAGASGQAPATPEKPPES